MRLGGAARYVLEVEQPEDVEAAYEFAAERELPTWVMGGGANTIGHDDGFPGVVILNRLKGISVRKDGVLVAVEELSEADFSDEIILVGMGEKSGMIS